MSRLPSEKRKSIISRTQIVAWGGTADLTYQVRLHETTGIIEFVYGSMAMSAAGAGNTTSSQVQIGFSWNVTANVATGSIGSVNAPQSGSPAPSYVASTSGTVATNIRSRTDHGSEFINHRITARLRFHSASPEPADKSNVHERDELFDDA
jgi:hypothetical protein